MANPNPLFKDGTGPGLDPVGGEFQPRLETGYPGGGVHDIFVPIPASCLGLSVRPSGRNEEYGVTIKAIK
jgi:hypothetical protein